MTVRLIVRFDDAPTNEGPVITAYRTFEVDLPEVEAVLNGGGFGDGFSYRTLVGAEVVHTASPSPKEDGHG